MDTGWIEPLALYAPVLALTLGFYVVRRRRIVGHANAILEASREAGLMLPASLHPWIDPARCLGCGTCVAACPEKNVLGIVGGKAALVSPVDCIGHGACKQACPVDAITLVLGTEERGVDIPVVSSDFETNVPGIFVAGELGGMGLVRNGIEQGRQAVDAIERRVPRAAGDDLDLVIIGAGPAGLSASLRAKELGLAAMTLEQESLGGTVAHYPRGKIVMTAPVDLPLYGHVRLRETTKEALLALWKDVITRTGVEIQYGEHVERVSRESQERFRVDSTGFRLHARAVLLAIGRRGTPRKLGVSGEELPKVVYRLIDPEQYAGRAVLVVGGGDSALEAACSLSEIPGTEVTLSYRQHAFDRAKARNRERILEAGRSGGVDLRLGTKVVAISPDSVELQTEQGAVSIPNDQVIVCAGGVLPTDFLHSMGIAIETRRGIE